MTRGRPVARRCCTGCARRPRSTGCAARAVVAAVLDERLLSILVCPVSKAPVEYDKDKNELICRASGLAYPVRDDIPVMLESEARQLTADEKLG